MSERLQPTADSHQDQPVYGASGRYLGEEGEVYFSYQSRIGERGAQINACKFAPFIRPTDTVIDFGCGGGYLLHTIVCAKRIGVEINPLARERTIELGIECHADTEYVQDGIADVIISDHALEHVPYPLEALRQLRRKLKPSGVLVLCVPIDDWRGQKRYTPSDPNYHLHAWTPQLFGNLLSEAGFKVNEPDISIMTSAWPPYYSLLYNRLPRRGFDFTCYMWAIVKRRRQLFAVLRSKPQDQSA